MVRQEAWRRDAMAGFGTYTEMVRIRLMEDGENPLISLFERGIIECGHREGSSPIDVARVIEASRVSSDARADAAYEAARFWEDVEADAPRGWDVVDTTNEDDGIPVISKHGDRETI